MLHVSGLRCSYQGQIVLEGIDLEVTQGEILCLLGPSGCGKTTLLRAIAGLERLDAGDVKFSGQSLKSTPVHARGFGLMFQEYALFPHMTVAQNVAFGLRMQHIADIDQRVRDVLDLVGLTGFERRSVTLLSGGERQRVALARSLAPSPRLLMLDEPLGALDANLRDRLVTDLRSIIKKTGLTAIYVTHDHSEAFAVADRIAIMNEGHLEQVGSPEEVFRRPSTEFAAMFMGLTNIVPVEKVSNGCAVTPLGEFAAAAPAHSLLLHPLGLSLVTSPIAQSSNGCTAVSGVVRESVFRGETHRLTIEHASGVALTLSIPLSDAVPTIGQSVDILINVDAVVPLLRGGREARKTALQ